MMYNLAMTPTPISSLEPDTLYRRLARSLDALPNRFPPADDGSDLRLLAKLFTPEEAGLAADLLPDLENPSQIANRLGRPPREVNTLLKEMSRKGLISAGKTSQGRLGFGLMPFVVGIYEAQNGRIDAELARLFEDYYMKAFGRALSLQPQVHRVIPVGVSVKNNLEVRPFESVTSLIDQSQSWGVIDCICRTQKALIGEPCKHPVDVCMVLSQSPDAFAGSETIRSLSHDGALETLLRAAKAGLVHSVSNNQSDLWYICNCCTCSCGILRGMVDLGIANVVARSAFINRVDEDLCIGCEECVTLCQFNALSVDGVAHVHDVRCVGCGVCVLACPQGALGLERRPEEAAPPQTEADWRAARMAEDN
jgi:Na+-translocating ferredoxin:NAD+ oxidoreductase subunit B